MIDHAMRTIHAQTEENTFSQLLRLPGIFSNTGFQQGRTWSNYPKKIA